MRSRSLAHSRGFNLVEVMVALVVISVGLLGIAKMQALALASTGTARMRSLAALEAASLASTIRADRAYWSGLTPVPGQWVVQIDNGSITSSTDGQLMTPVTCESAAAACSTAQITAYDLGKWATELKDQMKLYTTTLTCTAVTAGPVTCIIKISWSENRVAINSQADTAALATSYTLYVQP